MNRSSLPTFVRDKLDEMERTVAHLTEQAQRMEEGIGSGRARLSGAFKDAAEEADLRASLMQLVEDLPMLQRKLGRAKAALVRCKQFLNELPDDAVLGRVAVHADGRDRRALAAQLKAAEDELQALRAVPMPAPDIKERLLARGGQLKVNEEWPVAVASTIKPPWATRPVLSGCEVMRAASPGPDDDVVAIHESGHVLMAVVLGLALDYVQVGTDPRYMLAPGSSPRRRDCLLTLMAGCAAEQVVFDRLAAATTMSRSPTCSGLTMTRPRCGMKYKHSCA
jgi:hypothetical protein